MLADRARARILLALADGRALPASLLASEAGVSAATASAHLSRLLDGGLLEVLPQGRHRYYRLAGPEVGELVETMARLAPAAPVRSLREGTRAHALRTARTCYDHLAGQLGVGLFAGMIERDWVSGGDGRHEVGTDGKDRLASPGHDVDYRLTPRGADGLRELGVAVPAARSDGTVALRYCVDWSEQRHHVSGAVGRALAERLAELRWIRPMRGSRAVALSDDGRTELARRVGLEL
jgi:DNA-binding transcriptional ArsR family regulator